MSRKGLGHEHAVAEATAPAVPLPRSRYICLRCTYFDYRCRCKPEKAKWYEVRGPIVDELERDPGHLRQTVAVFRSFLARNRRR